MIIWYLQNAQWVHMEMTVNTTAAPRVVYPKGVKKQKENASEDVHPDGKDLCASKVRCSIFVFFLHNSELFVLVNGNELLRNK